MATRNKGLFCHEKRHTARVGNAWVLLGSERFGNDRSWRILRGHDTQVGGTFGDVFERRVWPSAAGHGRTDVNFHVPCLHVGFDQRGGLFIGTKA